MGFQLRKKKFCGDKAVFVITIVLSLISVLAVLSAATFGLFFKHLLFIALCFAGMLFAYHIDYRNLSKFALLFLVFAGVLLFVTLLFGNEERRGISIGGFEVQTFYFVGFLVIFFIAKLLAVRITNETELDRSDLIFLFLVVLGFTGGMAFSNMSTAIIFFVTCNVIMFIGNVKLKHLLVLLLITGVLGSVYLFGMEAGRSGTFRHRCHYYITNDNSEGYGDQMIKSQAAIARSGLSPTGPGQGVISKNLPEKDTDYVFTTVTEELGVFVSLLILTCYLIFFYRSTQIARKCNGIFGKLLAVGIGFWFCCQGLVHIGVNTGLMPATGQTLPFISRGGASLLFSGLATGVLLNISKDSQE